MNKQIVTIIMLVIVTACKKEDSMNSAMPAYVNNTAIAANFSLTMQMPENPQNPYDSVGSLHNSIVAHVLDCKSNTIPDANVSTQYVIKFYKQLYGVDLPASSFATVSSTVDESNTDIQDVIAGSSYNEMVKLKLDSLLRMINKFSDDNTSYPAIKKAIGDFENGVIQDNLLPSEDSEAILRITSIARFSIYYWMNVFKEPFQGTAFSIKHIVRWIAVTTSDIGGAIVSGNDVAYAADCSAYAYDLITYSMP